MTKCYNQNNTNITPASLPMAAVITLVRRVDGLLGLFGDSQRKHECRNFCKEPQMKTTNAVLWSANSLYDSGPARRGKCSKRSLTHNEAKRTATQYIDRVALQFGKFNAYYCMKHESWHVGHSGKRKAMLKALNSMIMRD